MKKKIDQGFKMKKHHYYFIYVFGFLLLSFAVFIFLKNIISTVPDNETKPISAVEIKLDSVPVSGNGELSAQELQELLLMTDKIELLPKDYKVQVYFYDEQGTPRSQLYFYFENGTVTQGKNDGHEISIATGAKHIPELKKSRSFCLVMEIIWVRDKDMRIDYNMNRLMALTKYGSFAKACVPSAMADITGFAVADNDPSNADMFYWYVVLLIAMVMGVRFYLDAIEEGL